MNSLDIGTCLLTCDGSTVYCGDESVSVDACTCVDGRVALSVAGFTITLLEEEWTALVGQNSAAHELAEIVSSAEEVTVPEVIAETIAPKKGRRKSS